jgi:hypothetical protein
LKFNCVLRLYFSSVEFLGVKFIFVLYCGFYLHFHALGVSRPTCFVFLNSTSTKCYRISFTGIIFALYQYLHSIKKYKSNKTDSFILFIMFIVVNVSIWGQLYMISGTDRWCYTYQIKLKPSVTLDPPPV